MYAQNSASKVETCFEALFKIKVCETDGWTVNSVTPSERCIEYILNPIKDHLDSIIDVNDNNNLFNYLFIE